jgi:ribonuclease P protein component
MAKYAVIKQNYQFRRAYNRGKSFVSPYLIAYCFKKKYGGINMGITSGKKIGNAVARNRSRRIIREAYRSLYPELSGNWDIIFVARTATVYKKSTDIAKVMRKQLKEAGVLK